ncbi:hypothetical protein PR048_018975 [Dryococelus australis]|uniref:DUF7805 domain-containing protein n=1 Tax=Dryococelus australis TaxID=614101 RepID=A0ABQ9H2A6_9NEOP|nr:hypothetical protein PR048_018975 [Dryococelus australis]
MYPRNVTCYLTVRQKAVPGCKHAMVAVRQESEHKMQIKRAVAVASLNKTGRSLRAWADCTGERDHLIFYDGVSTDDPVLVKFCGGDWLPRVVSRGPEMLVAFHSSPFSVPLHSAGLPSPLRGFELDVDVFFSDSDSLDYSRDPRRSVLAVVRSPSLRTLSWSPANNYTRGTTHHIRAHSVVKAIRGKESALEKNLRKKSLPLHAYILMGALSDIRPVKFDSKRSKKPYMEYTRCSRRPLVAQSVDGPPIWGAGGSGFESRASGGIVARELASHHGDSDSIPAGFAPGFSYVGIVLDDVACRRVFSGYSRFPRPCIPACPVMTGTYGSQLESPSLGMGLPRLGPPPPHSSENEAAPECKGEGNGRSPRNPPASGIVWYHSYLRRSGSDPVGDRHWFAVVSVLKTDLIIKDYVLFDSFALNTLQNKNGCEQYIYVPLRECKLPTSRGAVGRECGRLWVRIPGFLGDLPFIRPFIPALSQSPSSALKTSLLRAAQISSLTHSVSCSWPWTVCCRVAVFVVGGDVFVVGGDVFVVGVDVFVVGGDVFVVGVDVFVVGVDVFVVGVDVFVVGVDVFVVGVDVLVVGVDVFVVGVDVFVVGVDVFVVGVAVFVVGVDVLVVGVDVFVVGVDVFVVGVDVCEFWVNATSSDQLGEESWNRGRGRAGHVLSPRHTLPPNTTCTYRFWGKAGDLVWLYFVSYSHQPLLPRDPAASAAAEPPQAGAPPPPQPSADPAACSTRLRIWDGGGPDLGHLLGDHCDADPPRLCDHTSLGNATRATRPCSPRESYVSSGPALTLQHHTDDGTALHPAAFRLRYEFVDTRLGGEPWPGRRGEVLPCSRIFRRGRAGHFRSPRNVFLFGRGGAVNLSCSYRLEAGSGEKIRLTLHNASFGEEGGCSTEADPHTGRPRCSYGGGAPRTAELRIVEMPWKDVHVDRACLCDNATLSATGSRHLVFLSSSRVLEVQFAATRLGMAEDASQLYFHASWELVPAPDCPRRQRLRGSGGEVEFVSPPAGGADAYCEGVPWLVEAHENRSLFLLTWGTFLPLEPSHDEPARCHTKNRILLYSGRPARYCVSSILMVLQHDHVGDIQFEGIMGGSLLSREWPQYIQFSRLHFGYWFLLRAPSVYNTQQAPGYLATLQHTLLQVGELDKCERNERSSTIWPMYLFEIPSFGLAWAGAREHGKLSLRTRVLAGPSSRVAAVPGSQLKLPNLPFYVVSEESGQEGLTETYTLPTAHLRGGLPVNPHQHPTTQPNQAEDNVPTNNFMKTAHFDINYSIHTTKEGILSPPILSVSFICFKNPGRTLKRKTTYSKPPQYNWLVFTKVYSHVYSVSFICFKNPGRNKLTTIKQMYSRVCETNTYRTTEHPFWHVTALSASLFPRRLPRRLCRKEAGVDGSVCSCCRLMRVVCPAAPNARQFAVHVFSEEWFGAGGAAGSGVDGGSLYLQAPRPPSFLVEFVGRDPGLAALNWLEISRSRASLLQQLRAELGSGTSTTSGGAGAGADNDTSLPSDWECPHRCPELNACISSSLWCDGRINCPSGYDEDEAQCGARRGFLGLFPGGAFALLAGGASAVAVCLFLCALAAVRMRARHRRRQQRLGKKKKKKRRDGDSAGPRRVPTEELLLDPSGSTGSS